MSNLMNLNSFVTPIGNRIITPGVNIIPDEELQQLLKITFVKDQIKLKHWIISDTGVKIIFDEDESITPANDTEAIERSVIEITAMDTKQAIKTIVGTDDQNGILNIDVLNALKIKDTRKGVQKALDTQIEFLMEVPEKKE